jgi:glutamine phosphoribosylpyrophosphate amidotransferase
MNEFEKPRESCGLFGICGHPDAAPLTYFGLYALQHRGQESAGIAVVRDQSIIEHKGMGLVSDVFDMRLLEQLKQDAPSGMYAIRPPEVPFLPMPSPSWFVTERNPMRLRITETL